MQSENIDDTNKQLSAGNTMKKAGLFFMVLILLEIPLSFLIGLLQTVFPAEYATLISILITQGYLLLGAILYIVITKTTLRQDLHIRKYRISTFFLSLLVLITAAPMASWLNVFSQLFAKNQASTAIFSVTQQTPAWVGVLIIGCLPGFIEETLYRGILFTAFKKRSVLTGVVISALSFGLMHMNFNQILYAIYLGVVFALVVEATGSLVSTMILHMLFNAVNTAYIYIFPKLYDWLGQYTDEYASIDLESELAQTPTTAQLIPMVMFLAPLAIGGVVLTILLLKAIAKINGRMLTMASLCEIKGEMAQTKPVTIPLIIGWIICFLIAVMNLFAG